MARAIELARDHHPHPNPRVGAVIVDDQGAMVGEGSHYGPGQDHAEVVAIRSAGPRAAGATMFVTLEPCSHHGRTPPCVDAILEAGLRTVVIGAIDPDERVAGSGVSRLEESGVEVVVEEDESAAVAVDPGYFHQRRTGMARVVLKYAMTMDGSVAAADGSSHWITGEGARADAHRLRESMDAVMVGAGTLRTDNPRLDVRIEGATHQPVPVVLSGTGELPGSASVWERDPVVVSSRQIEVPSGELLVVPGDGNGRPMPSEVARALAERGLYDVLLEGGPMIAGAWWRAGLISHVVAYLGGKMGAGTGVSPLGGVFESITGADTVRIEDVTRIGDDLRVEFSKCSPG